MAWTLASFPRHPAEEAQGGHSTAPPIEESYLASVSGTITPAFAPLGWDWKVTAAVVASLPAREVVIAVLGTLYAVETADEAGHQRLTERLLASRHPDGSPVFTLGTALGLMVFFALCLQCVSTLAVIRRETNSWGWPLAAWTYMTALGYLGAFACYQLF